MEFQKVTSDQKSSSPALESNTQHREHGDVSLTHCQLTAPMMEKHTEATASLEITFQEGSSAHIKGERNTMKVW